MCRENRRWKLSLHHHCKGRYASWKFGVCEWFDAHHIISIRLLSHLLLLLSQKQSPLHIHRTYIQRQTNIPTTIFIFHFEYSFLEITIKWDSPELKHALKWNRNREQEDNVHEWHEWHECKRMWASMRVCVCAVGCVHSALWDEEEAKILIK